ncbi:MAG: hypothetical protein JWN78_1617 [Bacteroidota bacterium]|nr:hypothetical protein [Bacteroidota bacterium]
MEDCQWFKLTIGENLNTMQPLRDNPFYTKYLPNRLGVYTSDFITKFNSFFNDENNQLMFETQLNVLLQKINEDTGNIMFSRFAYLQGTPGIRHIGTFTIKDFNNFLLLRLVCLHELFCKYATIDDARNILLDRYGKAAKSSKLTYFSAKLHIHITDVMKLEDLTRLVSNYLISEDKHMLSTKELRIVLRLTTSLSPFERQFIIDYQKVLMMQQAH